MNHLSYLSIVMPLGLSLSFAAYAETYTLDPLHTNVNWHASHFGFSNPSGKFTKVEGILVLDEKKPSTSKLNVTVYTHSLVTGIEKFDTHLKSKDFLNTAQFPTATFISNRIDMKDQNTADVYGIFNFLGISKPLTLHVKLNKIGESPITQKKTAGFTANTVIKRSDYGMNYGLPGISDDVRIDIETEASPKARSQK